MSQKAFSKIWILVIVLVIIIGGVLIWQYWSAPEEVSPPITGGQEEEEEEEEETADWKIYRNEEYNVEIKYLKDWEVRTEDPSYWCQENPEYDCLMYIQFFPPSTRDYSWVDLVVYGNIWREQGEEVKTNGCKATRNYLSNGDYLFALSTCFGLGQEKTEEIYDQMLSTFRFLEPSEEIKTGEFEINENRITELQKAVDEGHQPWRLDAEMVVRTESLNYGFTNDDLRTVKQILFSTDVGIAKYEITHKNKTYIITVVQPGENKIWTIQEIELKR